MLALAPFPPGQVSSIPGKLKVLVLQAAPIDQAEACFPIPGPGPDRVDTPSDHVLGIRTIGGIIGAVLARGA